MNPERRIKMQSSIINTRRDQFHTHNKVQRVSVRACVRACVTLWFWYDVTAMNAVSGKERVQNAVFLEPKPLFSSAFTTCSRGWYLCIEFRMIWKQNQNQFRMICKQNQNQFRMIWKQNQNQFRMIWKQNQKESEPVGPPSDGTGRCEPTSQTRSVCRWFGSLFVLSGL